MSTLAPNGQVGPSNTHGGHIVDTTTASGGGSASAILAEVCRMIGNTAVSNGYYPVYVDLPRGNAGYCAYHSYGMCGSTPMQFAFFWNLDGDPGCDPQSGITTESQGLAALANVSGHDSPKSEPIQATAAGMVRLEGTRKWRQVRLDVQCAFCDL
jgi:hypothetical protein